MFWRMAGLSTASPVETILDKDNFTLEELLDEDEIIQECKALNGRLINFLRERVQVEQLIRYIVEEAPEDAEKRRTFKFPFIACEIFTCEVDIILKTLVEDEELMNLLFSFLEPNHSHSTLLAGYFSKVVVCLLLRKAVPFLHYIQSHQDIVKKLVDLIGTTSIMEVLIRLVGADEHMYSNYTEAMHWIQETDVLEMIVDKFSSSDCPEVHANAAETLCAITRFAPPGLSTKISSPSFIGRLFRHALEGSRPKSVLVNSLSVCISLLDPRRLSLGTYQMYGRQMTHGSTVTANPETVVGMLESLGDLLKLLDVSSVDNTLLTTYGKLQPPLGKHRLKVVEFISVLLTVGSEAAEKELISLGAVQKILDLFFKYPYNNFVHHHIENIIVSCLESKNAPLVEHLLRECDLVGKILQAEKNFTLTADSDKPTIPAEGRSAPRIGNIGHLTRISNKIIQLGNNNSEIEAYLQENSEWTDWQTNVLSKRNALENVYQWACGRPTALHDRNRDSDDDDYQDRDYDVAALANNLSQAFRYGLYNNDDLDEGQGSLERDDEDVYFDDESAEVVISSLRLGDDQEGGSLFTNSNWFAFEDDRSDRATGSLTSPSNTLEADVTDGGGEDNVIVGEDDDLVDTATSPNSGTKPEDSEVSVPNSSTEVGSSETDKPPEWVEWRETSDSGFLHQYDKSRMPVCRFFRMYGECREQDCVYKHTNEDIKECNMYKLGFCPNGPDCRYRHAKLPGPPPPVEEVLQKIQHLNSYNYNNSNKFSQPRNGGFPQQHDRSQPAQVTNSFNQVVVRPSAAESANVQQPQQFQQTQQPVAQTQAQSVPNGLASQANRAALPLPQGISRYFIVKSCNRENLELSVQQGVWATQRSNESKLNEAFDSAENVILIFSVNRTRHFQGCAKMMSRIGGSVSGGNWKYAHGTAHYGRNFSVKWLKLCELSFHKTRHLRNPYNENLPVKISRDCQELEPSIGEQLASLLYLEPDSELMAISIAAESKREEEKAKGVNPENGGENPDIVPFEDNEEEEEEESDDEEDYQVPGGAIENRGRGRVMWPPHMPLGGRGGRPMPGMQGFPGMMGPDAMPYGPVTPDGFVMPNPFGMGGPRGFNPYGPRFSGDFGGPNPGMMFRGRPPQPGGMFPPGPYGMMMGPGRGPFMGGMGVGGNNPARGGRPGGMPPMFPPHPPSQNNNRLQKRDPRGSGNDRNERYSAGSGHGKEMQAGGPDDENHYQHSSKSYQEDYGAGNNGRNDDSESEDEAPRRSRHGEGKKKRRDSEGDATSEH